MTDFPDGLLVTGAAGTAGLLGRSGSVTPVTSRPTEAWDLLAIDRSGSMSGPKIEMAKKGAADHADRALLEGYQVGVIAFGDTTDQACDFSTDRQQLLTGIDGIKTEIGTHLLPALQLAQGTLGTKAGIRVLVVFTDGMVASSARCLEVADALKTNGVQIIAVGTPDANRDFLEALASDNNILVRPDHQIANAIRDASRMLPAPSSSSNIRL